MTEGSDGRERDTSLTQQRYDRQARLFDITEAPVEKLLFGKVRRRLWADVSGDRVLEIGVGTGKNVPYHPPAAKVVAIDLSPKMIRRAQEKAGRTGRAPDFVLADAQHLPFRDDTFDAAAATFVFCSVPDPVLGLREVRRVTSGNVHLLEHVRAANSITGKLMDLINPIAVRMSGANINRETVKNVETAGIILESVDSTAFGIVKLIRGAPRREASDTGSGRLATAAR
jgi:SAM-dependent methyltransferase